MTEERSFNLKSIVVNTPIVFRFKNRKYVSFVGGVQHEEVDTGVWACTVHYYPTGMGDCAMELWPTKSGKCTLADRYANEEAMTGDIRWHEDGYLIITFGEQELDNE